MPVRGYFCGFLRPQKSDITSKKRRKLPRGAAFRSLLISLYLFAFFLQACQTPISEPVPATATIDTTPLNPPTPPTQESSPTPEVTPTVNVDALPKSEVAQLLAEGKVSYPEHWNNEQRREFGIAMAEYVNENVAGDKAYVEMNFPEIGDTKIAWSPEEGRWLSSHNTPESQLDLTGETLPPCLWQVTPTPKGRRCSSTPEGQEVVVPKINMPGELGEVSITDLYTMDQKELMDYLITTMSEANLVEENVRTRIQELKKTHFPLPVVIYEHAKENDDIYVSRTRGSLGSPHLTQIPEANVEFISSTTNEVLMPVLDPESKQLIGWTSIQQGIRYGGVNSFLFRPGEEPSYLYAPAFGNNRAFGNDADHSVGIFLLEKNPQTEFGVASRNPILESAPNMGGEVEIQLLREAKRIQELFDILSGRRLFAVYPNTFFYQHEE